MATGAAPALDPKVEETEVSKEASQDQPLTLKGRIVSFLTHVFQGREEYTGWRQ